VRTALVTGSTDGHGRLVALGLAERGWRVLFHGRDAARGQQVLEQAGDGGHELLLADLASLASVRQLAAEVRDRAPVALIVNNAGIISSQRRESADGAELSFAVNHLAHVALTEQLVADDAGITRIVSVASIGQAPFDWDDPMLERSYEAYRAYSQSKFAQICWTFDLAGPWHERRGITMDAIHPATLMDTTMVRENLGRVHSSVEQGAEATLRLVDDDGGTGRFFDGTRESRAIPEAYDPEERERIHELTARFL
jgi:NAD(P)-dependent dehydrogenase (short-subunit alcohol dehydrogenase family)